MKTRTIFSVLLFLCAAMAYGITAPWTNDGRIELNLWTESTYSLDRSMDSDTWLTFYDSLYQQEVRLIRFTNSLSSQDSLIIGISYRSVTSPSDTLGRDSLWWGSGLTWNDVRQCLHGILLNTATGHRDTFNVPQGNGRVHYYAAGDTTRYGSYSASTTIPFSILPALNNDTAYKLWVELRPDAEPQPRYFQPLPPPDLPEQRYGSTMDTLVVVQRDFSAPADSMLWLYRNWDDATTSDPELPANLLRHYPDDTRLLRHQFWRYYFDVNCDSTTHYGDRLIAIWENGPGDYIMDRMDNFSTARAIEDVQARIDDICVGGEAQPFKGLGWSKR